MTEDDVRRIVREELGHQERIPAEPIRLKIGSPITIKREPIEMIDKFSQPSDIVWTRHVPD